jgi:protein phosphatase
MGDELTPSVCEDQLAVGERWLVCTDGVHGYLDRESLRGVMTLENAEDAAREVVRRAVHAGTTDNATAVVLNVD